MEVIVLGGGLMGTATAFFLARRGMPRHAGRARPHRRRGHRGLASAISAAPAGTCRNCRWRIGRWRSVEQRRAICSAATSSFAPTGHLRLIFDDEGLRRHAGLRRGRAALGAGDRGAGRRRDPPPVSAALALGDRGQLLARRTASANPRLIAPAFAEAAARPGARDRRSGRLGAISTSQGRLRRRNRPRAGSGPRCCSIAPGPGAARSRRSSARRCRSAAHGPQMGVTEPLPHRILPVVGIWSREKPAAPICARSSAAISSSAAASNACRSSSTRPCAEPIRRGCRRSCARWCSFCPALRDVR